MLHSDIAVCVDQEIDPETGKPSITVKLNPSGRIREIALEIMSVAFLTIVALHYIEFIDAHFVRWLAVLTYMAALPLIDLMLGFIFNEEPAVIRIIWWFMRKIRPDKA